MRLAVCQLPDNLSLDHPAWHGFVRHLQRKKPALAILNELPFGPWIPKKSAFDAAVAEASISAHEAALPALQQLSTAVLGSRPVRGPNKLVNEAFLIADGVYCPVHHKHYFPEEPGFFEDSWFAPAMAGFNVTEYRGLRIGVLLCSELMFTEWARHYRRQGAHVIVVPRASSTSMRCWDAAARMAAIVSGCYVASSNRVSSPGDPAPPFGGRGFIYSPTGELLNVTSPTMPVVSVELKLSQVAEAQREYPCYVRELAG